MATILSHTAIPLAIGLALGQRSIPPRLLMLGILASILPDFDTIGFRLHIPYASPFGHRGFSHSLVLALAFGLICTAFSRRLGSTPGRTFSFVSLCMASHPLLDAMTTGGLGVALLWPFTEKRYFFPLRVIEVSPIGRAFFQSRGVDVLLSELRWVWLPAIGLGLSCYVLRQWVGRNAPRTIVGDQGR